MSLVSKKNLKVLLAEPRGFCAGVERAIEIVRRAIEKFGAPIYVYHEIVHNKYVVENLKSQGAIFIDRISDAPKGSTIIFSAHGVSKDVEINAKNRNLIVIDATCPLVKKVHSEAQKYETRNKKLVLIGHTGHPEVEGTSGRVNTEVILVQDVGDVENLSFSLSDELAYVTQTTLSVDDTQDIIDALVKKYPGIQGPELKDICYATQNRQNAVKFLVKDVQLLLVIGAKNSSNSNRLRDLGEVMGVKSYLIDDEKSIDYNWLNGVDTIGITAGASAPEVLLEKVLENLSSRYELSVETKLSIKENVKFHLPKELRNK